MKMMRIGMAALGGVLSWVLFAGVAGTTPTQEEFDEIVDREMFKFIHGEDYRSEVRYWKSRGVTDEMFGKAYVKIARRTMNEPVGDDDKCCKAINGISRFCLSETCVSNLLFVAKNSLEDEIRGHAIWTLSTKASPEQFVEFAEQMVTLNDLGFRAASELMSGLSENCSRIGLRKPQLKARMVKAMKRHIEIAGRGSVVADHALMRHDRSYGQSAFRRKAAAMMLDAKRSPLNGNKFVDRKKTEEEFKKVLEGGGGK